MRFRLRTLLLAMLLIGVLLGIGAWHPLLAGFLVLALAPLSVGIWLFWDEPKALAAWTIGLCIPVVFGAGSSYLRPLEVKAAVGFANFQMAFYQGRILFVRSDGSRPLDMGPQFHFDFDSWVTVDSLPSMQLRIAGIEYFRGRHWQDGWVNGWIHYPPLDFPTIVFGFRFVHVIVVYVALLGVRVAQIALRDRHSNSSAQVTFAHDNPTSQAFGLR